MNDFAEEHLLPGSEFHGCMLILTAVAAQINPGILAAIQGNDDGDFSVELTNFQQSSEIENEEEIDDEVDEID